MGETKLRECPFCGGEAECYELILEGWLCGCKKCGVAFHKLTEEEAIEAWNKRVTSCNE